MTFKSKDGDEVTVHLLKDDSAVDYIRKDIAEQREHDLLVQLELSEDTVEALEGLLKKAANEIIRLQHQNDLFRWINQNPLPANPAQKVATWPQGNVTYTPPDDWTQQGIILLKQMLTRR